MMSVECQVERKVVRRGPGGEPDPDEASRLEVAGFVRGRLGPDGWVYERTTAKAPPRPIRKRGK
jgi:hypothetical protein